PFLNAPFMDQHKPLTHFSPLTMDSYRFIISYSQKYLCKHKYNIPVVAFEPVEECSFKNEHSFIYILYVIKYVVIFYYITILQI
ncbi:hypothetical protein, partial [Xenorhabdus szentirmaii]|uniref:hypothetical protein n=1 Tax=Xenorhabdus szentirmaii TaxID=290112 RepID=UPI002B401E1D